MGFYTFQLPDIAQGNPTELQAFFVFETIKKMSLSRCPPMTVFYPNSNITFKIALILVYLF